MSNTQTAHHTKDSTHADGKNPDSAKADSTKPVRPSEPAPEPKPKLIDLSPTQLMGGALAAMTSAVVGARLGVAGTVLGAAVGSIVAGVAGTLYTTSLRHTKEKINSVIVAKGDPATSSDTEGAEADASSQAVDVAPPAADPDRSRPRRSWKTILVSTAAVFVLAFAAITTFEIVAGHAISGGQGTTLTQVSEGHSSSTSTQSADQSIDSSSQTSAEPSTPATSDPSSESTTSTSTAPESTAPPTTTPSATDEASTTSAPSTTGETDATTSGTETSGADTSGTETSGS
ncbi:MAG: hypothetical protein QM650_15520 [Microlunatus sp.]